LPCKLLLVGFEGFSKYWPNPAETLVGRLDGLQAGGCIVEAKTIPVSLQAVKQLAGSLEGYQAIMGVGLAPTARRPRLELAAVNLVDYSEPRGGEARLTPIVEDAPLTLPTGLPYREIIQACRSKGLPLDPGASIGTYMCNALAYTLHLHSQKTGVPAGFIHIPPDTATAMRLNMRNYTPTWILEETLKCIIHTLALLT